MVNGFFITGTDTNVGKSYIGTQLVKYLHSLGKTVQPRKPIESGCKNINDELIPTDGTAYYKAVEKKISLDVITPYRYAEAIAPPQAMSKNNSVTLQQVQHTIFQNYKNDNILVIEGAGGFYSPLCIDGSNADLAISLKLPVILVIGNKVGCINHCLLTIEAINNKNLSIDAIILNDIENNDALLNKNMASISSLMQKYYPHLQEKLFSARYKSHLSGEINSFFTQLFNI